jgi:ABC-2 type transport system ATP-binding protein
MSKPAIEASGLRKAFGEVQALDGLSLAVPAGTVLGLLGPNGSGKTTTVSILATSLRPDAGRATVAGLDVVTEAARVRRVIGLAGQFAAVDPNLTGRENLRLIGRLSRVGRRQARARADELLDSFGLNAAADRLVRGYSGGMRRRPGGSGTGAVPARLHFRRLRAVQRDARLAAGVRHPSARRRPGQRRTGADPRRTGST